MANQKNRPATAHNKARETCKAIVIAAKSVPCADCGNAYHYACMDFDHVRGEKVADVSRLVRLAVPSRVKAEIEKCEVVCSNCHRLRTFKAVMQRQPQGSSPEA